MKWKTEPRQYEDLIQITDEYVVHARGFTIGSDIWLDEYSLRLGHHRYWNDVLRYEYGCPEWESGVSWTLYSANQIEQENIYWSILGSGLITIQYPRLRNMDEEEFELVMKTLDELDVPDSTEVRFESVIEESDVDANSHSKNLVSPRNDLHSEQIRYGDLDGLGSVKWV